MVGFRAGDDALCGCDVGVNRSIDVRDGESSHGLASVNGSLYVGSRCRMDGDSHTVNGIIEVGDESRVRNLGTVNGRIRLGANVEVEGDAKSVNGDIDCGRGSKIHGRLTTVNGRIELRNTEVDEEVSHGQRQCPVAGKKRSPRRHRHQWQERPF